MTGTSPTRAEGSATSSPSLIATIAAEGWPGAPDDRPLWGGRSGARGSGGRRRRAGGERRGQGGKSPRGGRLVARLDSREDGPQLDLLSLLNEDHGDAAGTFGRHGDLHLHGLEDD